MTHYLPIQFEPGFFERAHILELAQNTFRRLRDAELGKIVERWDTIQDIPVLKFPPINDNGLY